MTKPPKRRTLDSKFEAAALEASRRSIELADAEAKLAPLRKLVAKARSLRDSLYEKIRAREGSVMEGAPRKKRKHTRRSGTKRVWTPESKIAAQQKRSYTRRHQRGQVRIGSQKHRKGSDGGA
jgi:hypothetical protein